MQCILLSKQQQKMERNIIKNINKNVLTENDQNEHKVLLKVNS